MTVLIKGAKIPKTCSKCPLCQFGGFPLELRCLVTDESINFDATEKRAGNCPLVEIPPHSRLIDADETKRVFGDYFEKVKVARRFAKSLVDNAIPTVIESEEE